MVGDRNMVASLKDGAKMVNAVANSTVPKLKYCSWKFIRSWKLCYVWQSLRSKIYFSMAICKIAVMGGVRQQKF